MQLEQPMIQPACVVALQVIEAEVEVEEAITSDQRIGYRLLVQPCFLLLQTHHDQLLTHPKELFINQIVILKFRTAHRSISNVQLIELLD